MRWNGVDVFVANNTDSAPMAGFSDNMCLTVKTSFFDENRVVVNG